MRRIFIIIMFVIGIIVPEINAQINNPLIKEGVEWGYCLFKGSFVGGGRSVEYIRMQFYGDTIMNGKSYNKLYMYDTPELDLSSASCEHLLRQSNDTVYVCDTGSIMEYYGYKTIFEKPLYVWNEDKTKVTLWKFDEPQEFILMKDSVMYNTDWRCYRFEYDDGDPYDDYSFVDGVGFFYDGYPDNPAVGFTFAHPYKITPMSLYQVAYLLYQRNLDGEIIFKTNNFDPLAKNDKTINTESINAVSSPTEGIITYGLTVATTDGSALTAYSLDGRVVAQGVGSVTLPAAGAYIVRTASGASRKVMVQ